MAQLPQPEEKSELEQVFGIAKAVSDAATQGYRILGLTLLSYEANNTEAPCAGKPRAGICEGAVGYLAILPRFQIRKEEISMSEMIVLTHSHIEVFLPLWIRCSSPCHSL